MNNKVAVLVLVLAGAARAQGAGDARIETLIRSLDDAKMPRTAMVLLAALAADPAQPDDIRLAAGARLGAQAGADPAVAQILLAQDGEAGKAPPALALQLARGRIERALQIAPPEEGTAFESPQPPGPALQHVAAEVPPSVPAEAQRELDRARGLLASIPAGAPEEADAHSLA